MDKNKFETTTIQPEGFTRVYFCPVNGTRDVDIKFSTTTKPLGGDPVGKTKEMACRYNIPNPPHKDLTAIVAIPISAVADNTVRTVALAKAQEIFTPPQPSPQ